MLKDDEQNILKALLKSPEKMGGICFTLAMRGEDQKIILYKREHQPCYGELRKYKKIHDAEATQPENRPGDLNHPFPEGTPEALSIGLSDWRNYEWLDGKQVTTSLVPKNQKFFDYILSDESPFVKGFGGAKNIVWNKKKFGFVLLDLSVDPTVLVNLLKYMQTIHHRRDGDLHKTSFDDLVELGLTNQEAFLATYLCNFTHDYPGPKLDEVYDYVFPLKADLQRIFDQNPVDLTGGTLRDRFDYSRKNLHKIFWSDTGVNFYSEISKVFPRKKGPRDSGLQMTVEEFIQYFKIALQNLTQEKERMVA
jgi:hypothetical protein